MKRRSSDQTYNQYATTLSNVQYTLSIQYVRISNTCISVNQHS